MLSPDSVWLLDGCLKSYVLDVLLMDPELLQGLINSRNDSLQVNDYWLPVSSCQNLAQKIMN